MDIRHTTTRRSVLQGLPLATVAVALPAIAIADVPETSITDSKLFALVEAWRAQYDDCCVDRLQAETDAAYESPRAHLLASRVNHL